MLVIPGTHDNVIGIAVGYGRQSAKQDGKPDNTADYIGKAVVGVGKNAFPLASYNGTTIEWSAPEVTMEKTSETYQVAQTQTHSNYEGRTEAVKEVTLGRF